MRITNKTLATNFLNNLNRNLTQMSKYQNQLSSGKVVTRASDDPMLVSKIMDIRNNIGMNTQYNSNISDTIGWVETQDGALNGATAILQRVRELIIYGANGTLSASDRAAIKDEVVQNVEGLRDVLNTNFDGRYIFAGQNTKTIPFKFTEAEGLTYDPANDKNIMREIGQGINVEIITSSKEVAGDAADGLGALLKNVISSLNSTDPAEIEKLSGELLGKLDEKIESMLSLRSRIGAINNRLEASKSRNETENLNLNTLLSQREDIDIAEKFMEYNVMSTVYQASLAAGSKILQPSLLDYLR
ncbi:flagellar hook-associated protein FlgL [Gudongella oleilytica]|uniref:flagellar hook-associated protein FlgL n=1 Tax=Gudongella oleilytica TaxID=1582259 RepID=UPI002A3624B1|nr:flagellar hook-associated protein FlgL [Gudongella oleilytica]MDY0256544.1 flagellar hook-associated protein FlgL [Gudongella oleilytica]